MFKLFNIAILFVLTIHIFKITIFFIYGATLITEEIKSIIRIHDSKDIKYKS